MEHSVCPRIVAIGVKKLLTLVFSFLALVHFFLIFGGIIVYIRGFTHKFLVQISEKNPKKTMHASGFYALTSINADSPQ